MRDRMKNTGLLALLLALCLTLAACGSAPASSGPAASAGGAADSASSAAESQPEPEEAPAPAEPSSSAPAEGAETAAFAPDSLPAYAGEAWVAVNGNQPYFTEEERQNTEAFENYSELDELGRCGVAWANVCPELMPTEDREDIGSVEPTGWHSVQYDGVDGGYLYNRCHLIGFQLSGENANERNLITGTRYLNIQGMLPFENMVADYVRETEHHVLYRVTPVFAGDNLVASGVLMEGWSVEDGGEGVCFCVYAYNVQPGVEIDYATGESRLSGDGQTGAETGTETESGMETASSTESSGEMEYVLNTSSHKFHLPDCSSVASMSDANRQDFVGSREEVVAQGYEPCGRCHP